MRNVIANATSKCPRIAILAEVTAILSAIEEHALTPEAIESVISLTERDDIREQSSSFDRERRDIEKRIARLVAAIETGGDAVSLVTKLHELETRKTAIAREVANLQPVPRLAPAVIENRLAEWRRLLRQSTTQARTVLQRVLRGRVTFTPRRNEISGEIDGYHFTCPTRFDKLFTGIAVERPKSLDADDRYGTENIGPDDTFDNDYGRLSGTRARSHAGITRNRRCERGLVPNASQLEPDHRVAQADRRLAPGGVSTCRAGRRSRTVATWKCTSRPKPPKS